MKAVELIKGMIVKMWGDLYVIENAEGDFIEKRRLEDGKFFMISNSEENRNLMIENLYKISDSEYCELFDQLIEDGIQIEKDGIIISDIHMDEMAVYSVPAKYYAAAILEAYGKEYDLSMI